MAKRVVAWRRLRALGVALLVCVPGLLLSVTPQTAFASGATATAAPDSGLGDGQWVAVTFAAEPAGGDIEFRQCIPKPVNVTTDCTVVNQVGDNAIDVLVNASGGATTYMPVYSDGDPQLATDAHGTISCDDSHPCVVAAMNGANNLATAAFAPISFAKSTAQCPSVGPDAAFGLGSAVAYRAIYQWQVATCDAPYNLPMIYAQSNSIDGLANFGLGQQQSNFAVTGPVPSITLPPTAPSYKLAPITGSAIVLAYRMYDRRGFQITNLTLTPWMIGQLFSQNGLGSGFALYANPGAASLNPGVEFPYNIQPVVRAEHSSETWVFTSWLTAALGTGVWPIGQQTIFPGAYQDYHASGSRGVAAAVQNPAQSAAGIGTIGFMDASTAAYYGLPTVNIRMPSGATLSATPASIAQGLSHATANADGTYAPDYTPTDPTAYPITFPTYMVVPTDQIPGAQAKTLAGFLRYAVQQGQANLPLGYAPLPAIMVDQSMAAADSIPQSSASDSSGASPVAAVNGASFGAGDTSLGGDLPTGDVGATSEPTAAATSASGSKPGPTASGPPIPTVALASSNGRWLLLGVAAVALLCLVTGPLTYVLARPWPPPWLRKFIRVVPFRRAGIPSQ